MRGCEIISKSIFMHVDEVAEILDVSEAYAYKLIRKLNKELAKTGCITISGRIDSNFFMDQFYHADKLPNDEMLIFSRMV